MRLEVLGRLLGALAVDCRELGARTVFRLGAALLPRLLGTRAEGRVCAPVGGRAEGVLDVGALLADGVRLVGTLLADGVRLEGALAVERDWPLAEGVPTVLREDRPEIRSEGRRAAVG